MTFPNKLSTYSRFDFGILRRSPIFKYHKKDLLEEDIQKLKKLNYLIYRIDCSSEDSVYDQVSDMLRWKNQFGYARWEKNLDTLNDGMGGLECPKENEGVCIVLDSFDTFFKLEQRIALGMVDVMVWNFYERLLFGEKFILFLQTDDPSVRYGRFGCHIDFWNDKENPLKVRFPNKK
jgi:hypothetical protein